MDKIPISELVDGVISRQFPFNTNLYDMLADDTHVAGRALINIIQSSLTEFEKNYVFIRHKWISIPSDGMYEFTDNYNAYMEGKISEAQIELIPKVIHTVGKSVALGSNFWEYNIPILQAAPGKTFTRGFYRFKLWYQFDAEGLPTSDSHIYGLDRERRYEFYKVVFDYFILKNIRSRTNIIGLSGIDILRVDDQLAELREMMAENADTSSDIFDAWR